jgi:hypothetical protein
MVVTELDRLNLKLNKKKIHYHENHEKSIKGIKFMNQYKYIGL